MKKKFDFFLIKVLPIQKHILFLLHKTITKNNIMKILKTFTNKFGCEIELVKIDFSDVKNMSEKIDETNFFLYTVANFKRVDNLDFKANFVSESGSQYMYTKEGVYRKSNHFCYQVGTCLWLLDSCVHSGSEVVGFCAWSDFSCYSEKQILDREQERKMQLKLQDISMAMTQGGHRHILRNKKITNN